MIQLSSLVLPDGMVWEDRDSWNPVAQTVQYTIGGVPVVYHQALQAGRPITLVAQQDQGWLTLAQVETLRTLADTSGALYNLTLEATIFSVVFRHHEAPAVEMIPLIPRGQPLAGDYFVGRIKLMTV